MKTETGDRDPGNPCNQEFRFSRGDTVLQVNTTEEGVVVRASRDTFSERRKASFIRELAAEGFIDESYQRFSGFGDDSFLPVRWLVDSSWLQPGVAATARTRRIMVRLLCGAGLVWLITMGMLVLLRGR